MDRCRESITVSALIRIRNALPLVGVLLAADTAPPQKSDALQQYGEHRPPWAVEGVDHRPGHKGDSELRSWEELKRHGIRQ